MHGEEAACGDAAEDVLAGLRARAKIAISCCFELTGKPASMRKSSSAQPLLFVVRSGGIESWLKGTAVA